ncbi:alpha-N-arabinofuranosidase [Microbacterium sp. NPDC089695]|uniref:arabinosylfuranosidase ArfA n=1 Tax=Microbacterium sp. NPDC089695 TaxID=3364198 RepID=UPI00380DCA36
MSHALITVDKAFQIGDVPRRLFGSFVEHMGRCVYTGIYEPGHPSADAQGFRTDVLRLVKDLGVSVARYPGGNFVSGYDWQDGIGPVAERPRRLDSAWHAIETNEFGLHEFVDWARLADVEIMQAVNLGTRGVDEARKLVEYANHPGGTELSDLRRANGAEDPFGIKLWCLGNELDGWWQLGHKNADEYGRLAREAAKAMRTVDPTIELVAVGSSGHGMPTFGTWEHTMLQHAYDQVDYVSLHAYYEERDGDAESFLGTGVDLDGFIESVVSTVDAVRAAGKHRKRVHLSFDEWNVWYMRDQEHRDDSEANVQKGPWREHPRLIEDVYNVTDAVVVGTMLHSLLRHGDRVRIANQAQLVNVIAPILAEPDGPAWEQTIYWPFARMAAHARGRILRTAVDATQIETKKYGGVDAVDVSATFDEETGELAFFLANRGLGEPAEVSLALNGFDDPRVLGAEVLTVPESGDRFTANTIDRRDVGMRPLDADIEDGLARTVLPPLSWAVLRIAVAPAR